MIPLGYMLKDVATPPPAGLHLAESVTAIHSLSNCVSSDFGDYIPLWKHNGWWLFDTANAARDAAETLGVLSNRLSLFYYEAYAHQYDDDAATWRPISPDDGFPTDVAPPASARLSGFDVVTFWAGTSPECSPLSCNGLAKELPVNKRCLFDSFEETYALLEKGAFTDSEPGPYRIVAVYEVDTDCD